MAKVLGRMNARMNFSPRVQPGGGVGAVREPPLLSFYVGLIGEAVTRRVCIKNSPPIRALIGGGSRTAPTCTPFDLSGW